MAAIDPVTAAINLGGQIIERLFPDPTEKAKAQIALLELTQKGELTEMTARADIVKAEASSENWLAASWRPILMLVFGGLIVARWFGWATPQLSEAEYLKLWSIVEFGIGGYVVGRSVEKTIPTVAELLKRK